ncbi:MAG: hypothetical protein WC346_09275 [Methanogenium sp.]|jgi:hypothetical protein
MIKYRNGNYDVSVDDKGVRSFHFYSNQSPSFPDTIDVKIVSEEHRFDPEEAMNLFSTLQEGVFVDLSGSNVFSVSNGIRRIENSCKNILFGLKIHAKNLHQYWDSWLFPYRMEVVYSRKFHNEIRDFQKVNNFPTPTLSISFIHGIHTESDEDRCRMEFDPSTLFKHKLYASDKSKMYLDLLRRTYGRSETNCRRKVFGTIQEMFKTLQPLQI